MHLLDRRPASCDNLAMSTNKIFAAPLATVFQAFLAVLLINSLLLAPADGRAKRRITLDESGSPVGRDSLKHPGQHPSKSKGVDKSKITDPTTQMVFGPGLEVLFHIYEGLDTQWRLIGDYDFLARVEEAGPEGFIYEWQMSDPADASGARRVEAADVRNARRVSLFYPKGETCTLVGFTNALRVSDALYRDLKAGKRSEFAIDGPEAVMVLHSESVPVPHSIKGEGVEEVNLRVEGVDVPVRCIKAVCDNGWTYWVLDNPHFPLMAQGNAPFRWVASLKNAYGLSDANKEAKNIFDQLNDGGVATSYLILFDFDKDTLRPSSKAILRSLSKYLKQKPDLNLQIEGHTCNIGGYEYNMDLSRRRAASVKRYLVEECGFPTSRFKTVGYGFTRPEKPNTSSGNRARNRRVVFRKF